MAMLRRTPRHLTWIERVSFVALGALGILSGCGPSPAPTPALPVNSPPAASASSSPSPSYADTLRIGLLDRADEIEQAGPAPYPLSNAMDRVLDPESRLVGAFLFNGLYRLDASLTPVPDLVDRPCDISADGLVFTCHLRAARFSDGDPVTADDVAFTYDLARSTACPFDLGLGCAPDDNEGLGGLIAGTQVLDASTVQIRLKVVSPAFLTEVLPSLWIDSRRVVEDPFRVIQAKSRAVGAKRLRAEAVALEDALAKTEPAPDCVALRKSAEPLVRSTGIVPPDPVLYDILPDGAFDACRYVEQELEFALGAAADSLDAKGVAAVAILYRYLPLNQAPVGTGPWAVDSSASIVGKRLVLTTSPGHVDSPPATRTIDVEIFSSRAAAAAALQAGTLDWLPIPAGTQVSQAPQDLYRILSKSPGLKFAEYATPDLESIAYNLDPGRLFSDKNTRIALATCIDKPAIVDAVTDGQGVPAYASLPPNVWASNPNLPIPSRDVPGAKALIEASGWQLQDGVYRKGDRSLGADIWVRPGRHDRVKFVELVAQQARACGFDIRPKFSTNFLGMVECAPHIGPETSQPADAWTAGGFTVFADPDVDAAQYESANIGTPDKCLPNLDGYKNPRVDVLVAQARSTYDILDRARAYREEQALLVQDPPQLFGWFTVERAALRVGLTSTAGPLRLDAPGWDWQLEDLVLAQ